MKFVFFGADNFSVSVLEALKKVGILPVLIVTNPDRPKGRKLKLTPPETKVWAKQSKIPILQPEKLDDNFIYLISKTDSDFFLVASYGKIIPKKIIDLPKFGSLNIHPSLLPKLRGPAPLQETIIRNEIPGVTIMKVNEKMDQGPIIAQRKVELEKWPIPASRLNKILAVEGANLFSEIIESYLKGKIKEKLQDDTEATYTKMIQKEDGLIDLSQNPEINYRKFLAYDTWPRAYFIQKHKDRNIKAIITAGHLEDGNFIIEKVIPEGKKEMEFEEFKRGFSN